MYALTRQFICPPSGLPGKAASFESATALRALLAIFRATWGWAFRKKDPDTGGSDTFHKRWARLSIPELAEKTGHSTTALRQTAGRLEGTYVERARPSREEPNRRKTSASRKTSSGKISPGRTSASRKTSNAVGGDLQHSCPQSSYRESSSREQNTGEKNTRGQGQNRAVAPPETSSRDEDGGDAVLATGKSSRETATSGEEASARRHNQPPEKNSPRGCFSEKNSPGKEFSETGFSETERGLSKRETGLLRKLTNAGVWPREAGKLVRRYSTGRVEANFQLWRRRKNDPEAPSVKSDGAFLRSAIAEGYAAFTEDSGSGRELTSARKAAPAQEAVPAQKATSAQKAARKQRISHKQKVSPREKRCLTREEGIDPAHFHRYRRAQSPEERQFLYLDPAAGGPEPRAKPRGDVPAM